jgi:hypothetical protein
MRNLAFNRSVSFAFGQIEAIPVQNPNAALYVLCMRHLL